jgi:hypothetical protein
MASTKARPAFLPEPSPPTMPPDFEKQPRLRRSTSFYELRLLDFFLFIYYNNKYHYYY